MNLNLDIINIEYDDFSNLTQTNIVTCEFQMTSCCTMYAAGATARVATSVATTCRARHAHLSVVCCRPASVSCSCQHTVDRVGRSTKPAQERRQRMVLICTTGNNECIREHCATTDDDNTNYNNNNNMDLLGNNVLLLMMITLITIIITIWTY